MTSSASPSSPVVPGIGTKLCWARTSAKPLRAAINSEECIFIVHGVCCVFCRPRMIDDALEDRRMLDVGQVEGRSVRCVLVWGGGRRSSKFGKEQMADQ